MNGPGEQFLAGTGLALEQHGRPGGCSHGDGLQNAPDGGRISNDLPLIPELHDLLPERLVLSAQSYELQRLVHRQLELLRADRLGDMVDRAGLDRRHRVFDARMPGEHDERDVVSSRVRSWMNSSPVSPGMR